MEINISLTDYLIRNEVTLYISLCGSLRLEAIIELKIINIFNLATVCCQ